MNASSGRPETLETTSLHLDVLRELERNKFAHLFGCISGTRSARTSSPAAAKPEPAAIGRRRQREGTIVRFGVGLTRSECLQFSNFRG